MLSIICEDLKIEDYPKIRDFYLLYVVTMKDCLSYRTRAIKCMPIW